MKLDAKLCRVDIRSQSILPIRKPLEGAGSDPGLVLVMENGQRKRRSIAACEDEAGACLVIREVHLLNAHICRIPV